MLFISTFDITTLENSASSLALLLKVMTYLEMVRGLSCLNAMFTLHSPPNFFSPLMNV